MKFEITDQDFKTSITCTEEDFPKWMCNKEYEWWVKSCVLTLKVGESVESDFHLVKRIA